MKSNPFKHIRVVYRRSSILVKSVVLATLVLSILALIVLRISIQSNQGQQANLQQQAAVLEQENRALTKQIAELGTVESVKRIATLQLGLVDPNSQFFTPSN
jgi:cell division protein FtsL